MRSTLRALGRGLARSVLGGGGLPKVFHERVVPRHYTILMYHGVLAEPLPLRNPCFVTQAAFRDQMAYLSRHCQVLSLERAMTMSQNGEIDRPTVVITFDDGLQSNFDLAFPILKEFDLPATIFLSTSFVDTADTFWYCRLHDALAVTGERSLTWNGRTHPLDSLAARTDASQSLPEELKKYPHAELLAALDAILCSLGVDPREPVPEGSPYRVLGSRPIAAMQESGLVSFGGHTKSHAILSGLEPRSKREEIEGSLTRVTELTGRRCSLFAYPNGGRGDYDPECISILRNAGATASVTTVSGGNTGRTPPFELRRYNVGPGIDERSFPLLVHHLLPYIRNMVVRSDR